MRIGHFALFQQVGHPFDDDFVGVGPGLGQSFGIVGGYLDVVVAIDDQDRLFYLPDHFARIVLHPRDQVRLYGRSEDTL